MTIEKITIRVNSPLITVNIEYVDDNGETKFRVYIPKQIPPVRDVIRIARELIAQ